MHLGCCSTFGKHKNTLACGSSIFTLSESLAASLVHGSYAILRRKPFSIPLINRWTCILWTFSVWFCTLGVWVIVFIICLPHCGRARFKILAVGIRHLRIVLCSGVTFLTTCPQGKLDMTIHLPSDNLTMATWV